MTQTNTDNKTEKRSNRFSGESIMLTKEEAIIHDRLFINDKKAPKTCKNLYNYLVANGYYIDIHAERNNRKV